MDERGTTRELRRNGKRWRDAAYWFLMQIGMIHGFVTAYPVNIWLVRRGIK